MISKHAGVTKCLLTKDSGQITGIAKLAFWASMLDTHTENITMKISSRSQKESLRGDICNEFLACIINNNHNNKQ